MSGPSVSVAVVGGESVRLREATAAAEKAQQQGSRRDEDTGHDIVLLRDHASPSQGVLQGGNTQTQDGISPPHEGYIGLKDLSIDRTLRAHTDKIDHLDQPTVISVPTLRSGTHHPRKSARISRSPPRLPCPKAALRARNSRPLVHAGTKLCSRRQRQTKHSPKPVLRRPPAVITPGESVSIGCHRSPSK